MSGWDGVTPAIKAISASLAELSEVRFSGDTRRSRWMYDLLDRDIETQYGVNHGTNSLAGAFQPTLLDGVEVPGEQRLRDLQFFGEVRGSLAGFLNKVGGFVGHAVKLLRLNMGGDRNE